ncbi:hypothetical protein Tco_1220954 [Tanacetum coccineum]
MVPKAVLMRSGLVSLTTARPVNTAQPRTIVNSARPMTNVFNKAHSTIRRPINNKTTTKNSNFNKRVNTVSGKNVNTARPKAVVNTAKPKAVLNAVKGNQVNAVKASACWIQVSDGLVPKEIGFLTTCAGQSTNGFTGQDKCLGGNPKGGKIIGRGTIKTGNLDFENVYFLTDESHVLLKVPRKNNMYSVDLKNIVPKGEVDPKWLLILYALTKSMNYKPVVVGNQSNGNTGTKACDDAGKPRMETVPGKDYILLPMWPMWPADPLFSQNSNSSPRLDSNFRDNKKKKNPKSNQCIEGSNLDRSLQDELLQFKLQKVWTLVGLPNGKKAISTKWVFKNKKDERGIVIKNKASWIAQASTPMETQKPLLKDEDGEEVDCKKQNVVANSTTEDEYVAASSCCGQVLWIQNQLLDYSSIKYALTVNPTIYTSCIEQFWSTVKAKTVNGKFSYNPSKGKKIVILKSSRSRGDIKIPQSSVPSDPINIADEAVNEEPSMQLKELMDFYTKLQQRVLDLENTKTAQDQEITI